MKAICPKCRHVMYWFADDKPDLAPEFVGEGLLEVHCEYDGATCVSAPGNQMIHNCGNCIRAGIYNARTFAPTVREMVS